MRDSPLHRATRKNSTKMPKAFFFDIDTYFSHFITSKIGALASYHAMACIEDNKKILEPLKSSLLLILQKIPISSHFKFFEQMKQKDGKMRDLDTNFEFHIRQKDYFQYIIDKSHFERAKQVKSLAEFFKDNNVSFYAVTNMNLKDSLLLLVLLGLGNLFRIANCFIRATMKESGESVVRRHLQGKMIDFDHAGPFIQTLNYAMIKSSNKVEHSCLLTADIQNISQAKSLGFQIMVVCKNPTALSRNMNQENIFTSFEEIIYRLKSS